MVTNERKGRIMGEPAIPSATERALVRGIAAAVVDKVRNDFEISIPEILAMSQDDAAKLDDLEKIVELKGLVFDLSWEVVLLRAELAGKRVSEAFSESKPGGES